MHLPDDLIRKAFFDSESLGFKNAVAVRYQLPILNEFDSSGGGHIFCHTDCIQKFEAGFQKIMFLQAKVALPFCIGQCVKQCLIHTLRRQRIDPHTHCQLIRGLKGNTCQLTQAVRMIPDDVHGFFSVFPIELHRPVGTNTVGCQKSDHIPGATVSQVRINDLTQLLFADTLHGKQLPGLFVEDLQCFLSEGIVDLLCSFLPDTTDLAGSKVCDDTLSGRCDNFLITLYLKLDSVLLGFAPVPFHPVLDLIGGRQTVSDSLESVQDLPCSIPQCATGPVHGDHETAGTCRCIPREYNSFELTKHSYAPS